LFGLGKPVKATKKELAGYKKLGSAGTFRVICDTQQYFAVNGTWQPIIDGYAAEFPGKSVALDPATCLNLKLGTTQLGRFVISPAKLTYLLSKGKRRLVGSAKQYAALRGTTPAAVKIDATLNSMLPLGTALEAKTLTPIPNPTDSSEPTTPPTPAPTTGPSVTPTPTPSPSAKTYVVVSGDTLSKIATKFGITVAALKLANGLTSDLISIGKKLIIP
jgi:LysM repeat protein